MNVSLDYILCDGVLKAVGVGAKVANDSEWPVVSGLIDPFDHGKDPCHHCGSDWEWLDACHRVGGAFAPTLLQFPYSVVDCCQ